MRHLITAPHLRRVARALTLTAGLSPVAGVMAQELAGGSLSGTASLATDYLFRGISQTDEEPQVQADFSWTHDSGFYLGVWGSNTDFGGPGNSMEIDPFIGFANTIGDSAWSYDVGYWHYHYPGAEFDFDYGEFYAILTHQAGPLSIAGSLWYADDYFGDDFFGNGSSLAYQGQVTWELSAGLSVSGTLGEQAFDEPGALRDQDYIYYDLGVSKTWEGFTLDLRWHDTDGVRSDLAASDLADSRVVARLSKSF